MKLTTGQKKALAFVATHPGTRRRAFPWGFAYHFDAPELKRAPFRVNTLNQIIEKRLVTHEGPVMLTDKGRALHAQLFP